MRKLIKVIEQVMPFIAVYTLGCVMGLLDKTEGRSCIAEGAVLFIMAVYGRYRGD